jgi:hypothetical protein
MSHDLDPEPHKYEKEMLITQSCHPLGNVIALFM